MKTQPKINDNEPSSAEELIRLSGKQVYKRALEIASLPIELRENGFVLAEQMYREGFAKIGADEKDFERWLQALLVEIRQVVHEIDASGGAGGGNA